MTNEVLELFAGCLHGKNPEDFVFLPAKAAKELSIREMNGTICVSVRGSALTFLPDETGEAFKKYVGLNLHDFRRSVIRNMTRRGVNDVDGNEISGHKTRAVFMRYNIVDDDDLKDAARRIEA